MLPRNLEIGWADCICCRQSVAVFEKERRMKVWRCRICGDPYVGAEAPSHCPFCGAERKYITPAADWVDPVVDSLSGISKANLESALGLEVSNAEFYLAASKEAEGKDHEAFAMFKAISKVEAEHAATIVKILKVGKPSVSHKPELSKGGVLENMNEAHAREERAIRHYSQAAGAAQEPRVKEVLSAFVEIEKTHLELSESHM
jgi:rubrerythrin